MTVALLDRDLSLSNWDELDAFLNERIRETTELSTRHPARISGDRGPRDCLDVSCPPSQDETPELDSLFLFASGVLGVGGYVSRELGHDVVAPEATSEVWSCMLPEHRVTGATPIQKGWRHYRRLM
jgi:hypothetical protein